MEENITEQEIAEQAVCDNSETEELRLALHEAKLKAELLLNGVTRSNLGNAAALAETLCNSGSSAEQAAEIIAEKYPHLRLEKREVPQFAAAESGTEDGFSAIRRIFAKR